MFQYPKKSLHSSTTFCKTAIKQQFCPITVFHVRCIQPKAIEKKGRLFTAVEKVKDMFLRHKDKIGLFICTQELHNILRLGSACFRNSIKSYWPGTSYIYIYIYVHSQIHRIKIQLRINFSLLQKDAVKFKLNQVQPMSIYTTPYQEFIKAKCNHLFQDIFMQKKIWFTMKYV